MFHDSLEIFCLIVMISLIKVDIVKKVGLESSSAHLYPIKKCKRNM